ncbi:relaxase/mobilization nuclease domain-containing protein [Klebsiella variicola]|uniref:relaxase/mobilization nuclease domain-containing protein n=1 Tax=Klebsiella variicola TaxID=244366 RepID=UPI00345D7D31
MNKIKRGKNFRGVISYALALVPHHRTAPVLIGGNLVGTTVEELTAEFTRTQQLRKDVEKPVWHNSLRLPRGDSLTNEQWTAFADDYMERMGFSKTHLRCYVLHDDEAGQHIHIISSRIDLLQGQLYLGRNENLISTRIIQDLEKAHHLTQTVGPSPARTAQKHRKLTRNENIMEARTGEKSSKKVLQDAIDAVLSFYEHITIDQFVYELGKLDITAKANVAATGKMNGFSFIYRGIAFKASQLGKAYGWLNLSQKVIAPSGAESGLMNVTSVPEKKKIPENNFILHEEFLPPSSAMSYVEKQDLEQTKRVHWLQWVPYIEEILQAMKSIGLSLLKPTRPREKVHFQKWHNNISPQIFDSEPTKTLPKLG